MTVIFLFFLSSLISIVFARNIKNHPYKIYDIIHDNFDELKFHYASDIMIGSQVFSCLYILYPYEFEQFLFIMSITQILKTICFITTVLPPLKNLNDKIRVFGVNGNGTEYIFSGHASYSALSFIFLAKKGLINIPFLIFYNILSQFFISLSRNHYTVDIILAWIIVPLLYSNLYLCNNIEWCSDFLNKSILTEEYSWPYFGTNY